jgi:hypothetical protein
MDQFEDHIRQVLGVGGMAPSSDGLLEDGRPVSDVAGQLTQTNANIASLARAVAGLQTAAIDIATEIDKLRAAKGIG